MELKARRKAVGDIILRSCDACGKRIGGGFSHCPKCGIYFCFMCAYRLQKLQYKFPPECPMCRVEFI